jgi:(p)ppGpp synthase/HD superfamily hydrolase
MKKTFTEEEMCAMALRVAETAHDGSLDLQGRPYFEHVEQVTRACFMMSAVHRMVAALHDVLEDTYVTPGYLKDLGFPPNVLQSLDAITCRDGELYADYVVRCSKDRVAKDVKVADLHTNHGRCITAVHKFRSLEQKYARALEFMYGRRSSP